MRQRVGEPAQIESRRVVVRNVEGIHQLHDVVDDRLLDEEYLPLLDNARKPAARAEVDDEVRLPMVNDVLHGSSRGDLAPAAVKELDGVRSHPGLETFAIRGGFNVGIGK